MHRYLTLVAEYPWLTLRLQMQPQVLLPDAPAFFENLGQTESGRGTLDVIRMQGIIAGIRHYFNGKFHLLGLAMPLLLWVGVLYGAVSCHVIWSLMNNQGTYICYFVLFILFFLILPGPIVMPRYHLPALPMMCILGAHFLSFIKFNGKRITFTGISSK